MRLFFFIISPFSSADGSLYSPWPFVTDDISFSGVFFEEEEALRIRFNSTFSRLFEDFKRSDEVVVQGLVIGRVCEFPNVLPGSWQDVVACDGDVVTFSDDLDESERKNYLN